MKFYNWIKPFISLLIIVLTLLAHNTIVLADAECMGGAGEGCGIINSNVFTGKWCEVNGFKCYFTQNQAEACTANSSDGQPCCSGNNASSFCTNPPTPTIPAPTPTPAATATPAPFTPYSPPTNETFDAVNPLNIAGGNSIDASIPSQFKDELSTPGGIISRALTFIFPLAGLLLFALLVWGGFEMLIGSPTKKSMESGKNRVTAAIAGFFLLFAAYWIWQIVEVIFGVAIL